MAQFGIADSHLEAFVGGQQKAKKLPSLPPISSDALPGLPTQEQILELRAKGVMPARQGGFGYLRGPDGALIENAQAGQVERFYHIHMYHEHPLCAMQWYVAHLGATINS